MTGKIPQLGSIHFYFEEAGKEARRSMCLRDRCGAVVVMDGKIIGRGYNAPPNDDPKQRMCHLDLTRSPKPKSDRTCCVHAEWRAIRNAERKIEDISGSSIYFTRIDKEGNLLPSLGEPYCTVCSRLALDAGIKYFVLWDGDTVRMYDTEDFNRLSYEFHTRA